MISFDGRAGSLTGNSPIVSCEKECLGASDEGIYEWTWVRRLFFANSRHLVLARIKTPKNSYKTPESAVSCTLQMAGFRISKSLRAFFYAPNQEKCPIIPSFLPESQSPILNGYWGENQRLAQDRQGYSQKSNGAQHAYRHCRAW